MADAPTAEVTFVGAGPGAVGPLTRVACAAHGAHTAQDGYMALGAHGACDRHGAHVSARPHPARHPARRPACSHRCTEAGRGARRTVPAARPGVRPEAPGASGACGAPRAPYGQGASA